MKSRLAVACLLIFACAPPSAPQNSNDKDKPASLTPEQAEDVRGREQLKSLVSLPPELKGIFMPADLAPVALPQGKGSWALKIKTRGGSSDAGSGDVTVTSDGRVYCDRDTPCAFKKGADLAFILAPLSERVADANPSKWKSSVGGMGRVTLFVLQRRAWFGGVRLDTFYWGWKSDSASGCTAAAAVPADVIRIIRTLSRVAPVPVTACGW